MSVDPGPGLDAEIGDPRDLQVASDPAALTDEPRSPTSASARPLRGRLLILAAASALCLVACDPGVVEQVVIVDRSSCLACHRPLLPDGTPSGIEEAHPPVEGRALDCHDCHGGDPGARKQSEAHPQPLPGDTKDIRRLSSVELDRVAPDYLRFVNPGDLRAAPRSCGAASAVADGAGCHQSVIDAIAASPLATFAGDLAPARYRSGVQRSGQAIVGIKAIDDPAFEGAPGTVEALEAFEPPRIVAGERALGPYQDLYLAKACPSCHLWSFGRNDAPGLYRSSGCSACHVEVAEDGLGGSDDPLVDRSRAPRPARHALVRAPATEQCVRCHHEGARVGLSYQGIRERGGPGTDPEEAVPLGRPRFGHDSDHYLTDEDGTNAVDETPPDVHFEAGMHCVDCHTARDVHGDGRIVPHAANAVEIECEDCHGGADREASFFTRQGTLLTQLERDEEGVWLIGKVTGKRHRVTQIARSLQAAEHGGALHRAMGRDESGFSHLDRLECATCHSAWVPTCYGCHLTVDMSQSASSALDGRTSPGAFDAEAGPARVDRLLLMLNTEGRVAPSMPAERLFMTVLDGSGARAIDKAARVGPDGSPGMGHRAVSPHTVQRTSPFQRCAACHPRAGQPAQTERERLAATLGFGSGDFVEIDGEGTPWILDLLLGDDLSQQVLVGHDQPFESRPLTSEIINRMLGVEVEGDP